MPNNTLRKGDILAIRRGNRIERVLFPASIDEYIPENSPARFFDAFVEALDLTKLGIAVYPFKPGCPTYDPKAMLKLLIYGTSYGVRSSRKLERAVNNDLSFIWLMGGLKPDHKTISEFRGNNKAALKYLLKACVSLCVEMGLIAGNILFVDGSKMRANAGIARSWTREKLEEERDNIDEWIEELVDSSARLDCDEEGLPSEAFVEKELLKSGRRKKKIAIALDEMERREEKRKMNPPKANKSSLSNLTVNVTDPDCVRSRSRQGSHASYNAQVVTDDENGFIVSSEAVADEVDWTHFANQINNASENMGKKCSIAVGDAGYADVDELEKIDRQKIRVIVPAQSQASGKAPKRFAKENFKYDKERDIYICPEEKELKFFCEEKDGMRRYGAGDICLSCCHYGVCTKSKIGRCIKRHRKEESVQYFKDEYAKPESQKIYKHRKERAEVPFGHFKRNLGAGHFLLRGINGVNAELSILSTCFNLIRMINICGVAGLIAKLVDT